MSLRHVKILAETAKAAAANHPLKDEVLAIIAEAEKELSSLENAAYTLGVNGCLTAIEDKGHKDECEAVAVLKVIAKEAT